MTYLVHMKLAAGARSRNPQEGVQFLEEVILPTLALCQQLQAQGKILAGGPVSGAIALVLLVRAESTQELDQLVESLPVWPLMETTVTPLIRFEERAAALAPRLAQMKAGLQGQGR